MVIVCMVIAPAKNKTQIKIKKENKKLLASMILNDYYAKLNNIIFVDYQTVDYITFVCDLIQSVKSYTDLENLDYSKQIQHEL